MKKLVKLVMAVAVSAACSAASADVVTFDQFGLPNIYSGGEVLTNGLERITVIGQNGFDGAIINGADPSSCDIAACPSGNTGGYYAALNDGGFTFDVSGATFNFQSIDFGFILPVAQAIDFTIGKLIITGSNGVSVTQDFAQQVNGVYSFQHWNVQGLGLVNSATLFACLYTDSTNTTCINPANYQAQFAVDNLAYNVPEPTGMALSALALAALVAARRRNKAQ